MEQSPLGGHHITSHHIAPNAGTSFAQTVSNSINSFIGVGVLLLPYGAQHAGVPYTVLLMIVVGCVISYTMKILVRTRVRVAATAAPQHDMSYEELAHSVFGPNGSSFVRIGVLSSQIGSCVLYIIYISDNLSQLSRSALPPRVIMLGLFVPLLYIAFLRDFRVLAKFSAAGVLSSLIGIALVLMYGLSDPHPPTSWEFVKKDAAAVFGMVVFSMEGVNLALPIHASMQHPHTYERALDVSMIFTATIYILFAVLGVYSFGEQVSDVITCNLPRTRIVSVIQLLLVLELYCSYAVQIVPVLQAADQRARSASPHSVSSSRAVWRVGAVILTVMIAEVLPLFGLVTSLVGSIAFTGVGFLMPCALYVSTFGREIKPPERVWLAFVMVVGATAGTLSTIRTLGQLADAIRAGELSGGGRSC